jgi:SAM-dependent methyltransferase
MSGLRLNLGFGPGMVVRDGFRNLNNILPADLLVDIRKGLPFADESVDAAVLDNVVQQFSCRTYCRVLNEVHRVLAPNGRLTCIVPDATTWLEGAISEPNGQLLLFGPKSFEYLMVKCELWQRRGRPAGWLGWTGTVAQTGTGLLVANLSPVKGDEWQEYSHAEI